MSAASVRFFVVATAWRICMKRGSTSRSSGWLATCRDSGWRTPAATSSPCPRKTSIPSAPRTTCACVKGAAEEQVGGSSRQFARIGVARQAN